MAENRGDQILRVVVEFRAEHGISPTMREIAALAGVSRMTVLRWVLKLRSSGVLTSLPGRMRSLQPKRLA